MSTMMPPGPESNNDLPSLVLSRSDGRDLGDLVDSLWREGHPVHLVSRAFNDLLADGLIDLDHDQRVTRRGGDA